MTVGANNPFDLVKASDLTDQQIKSYWVDLPHGGGLLTRVKPTSAMPMFILGGKGSGKTHLMRYLSYPLQKLRAGQDKPVSNAIADSGYLGIYVLCGGLNGSRFHGKNQPEQTWSDVFVYYFEIWLARLLIGTIQDAASGSTSSDINGTATDAIFDLFDMEPFPRPTTLADLVRGLEVIQRSMDVAINNASLARTIDVTIHATRGRLAFGIPKILTQHFDFLRSARVLYLLDEYENLTLGQQSYMNTLVRERVDPVGIKIGARLYGVHTYATLNNGEENRKGNEFEVLELDHELRSRPPKEYKTFAEQLVAKRLAASGYVAATNSGRASSLAHFFETTSPDVTRARETNFYRKRFSDRERPHIKRLREALEAGVLHRVLGAIQKKPEIATVIQALSVEDDPFVEKVGVLLFYRAWSRHKDLKQLANEIRKSAVDFKEGRRGTAHQKFLKHFEHDVWAQMYRETDRPQMYVGFDAFVAMSAGLPRCLLTTLKHVFTWAQFLGEEPFGERPISIRAQQEGAQQTAEWFFNESRAPGANGVVVRSAMTRLGELLRDLRFSDKPSECALSTFSVDLTHATPEVVRVLQSAEQWSMLINIEGGQHDRNTGSVDTKYRVHPMLCPRWDLPYVSRGAIDLSGEEANAIFDEKYKDAFADVRTKRKRRMTAPFSNGAQHTRSEKQPRLPGVPDD